MKGIKYWKDNGNKLSIIKDYTRDMLSMTFAAAKNKPARYV
jgi:hypothetical protein